MGGRRKKIWGGVGIPSSFYQPKKCKNGLPPGYHQKNEGGKKQKSWLVVVELHRWEVMIHEKKATRGGGGDDIEKKKNMEPTQNEAK